MGIFDKIFGQKATPGDNSGGESYLPAARPSKDIVESLLIPEPTKSLLWVTDEDTSNIEHAGSINLVVSADGFYQKENSYFSEPSLIWKKLPIEPNNELIEEAMYWPSYSSFSPKARYQYLHWLRDVTQPTNLSYVFLYFYGLERHLLVGEYDLAVDEIARLIKAHPKKSFVQYASQSLIVASLAKERLDIIDRVPSLLEEEIDEALALRVIKGTTMTPDDIISIASKVGFTNKRYIKLYPEVFSDELQTHIDRFEGKYGKLLSVFKLQDFKKAPSTVFANLSIPERIRHISTPIILDDERFKTGIRSLLQAAHNSVKERVASGEVERRRPSPAKKTASLIERSPVTDQEVDEFITSLRSENPEILDLHFAILGRITEYYRNRQNPEDYHMAVVSCRAQIKIQHEAAKKWLRDYPTDGLPAHTGYTQLAIILEKEKKYKEALELVAEAKGSGWSGDWDNRMARLKAKI